MGFDNYEHAGVDNSQQRYANNDFKMNYKFSFDLTPHIIKLKKYVDASNGYNNQRGLYLFVKPFGQMAHPLRCYKLPK